VRWGWLSVHHRPPLVPPRPSLKAPAGRRWWPCRPTLKDVPPPQPAVRVPPPGHGCSTSGRRIVCPRRLVVVRSCRLVLRPWGRAPPQATTAGRAPARDPWPWGRASPRRPRPWGRAPPCSVRPRGRAPPLGPRLQGREDQAIHVVFVLTDGDRLCCYAGEEGAWR
jgi:hypothetical protein